MTEYKFLCPQCGQHIRCSDEHVGTQINCPKCQKPIIISRPKAAASSPVTLAPINAKGSSNMFRMVLICVVIFGISVGLVIGAGIYFSRNQTGKKSQQKAKPRAVTNKNGFSINLSGWAKNAVPPIWVKLVRSGSMFSGYYSSDGSNWLQLAATNMTMSSHATAGLVVSSHDNASLNTVTFDNVTTMPSYTNTDIGEVKIAGSANYSNGVYTVSGSGSDIFNTVDQFNYAYQSASGDVTIVARVVSESGTQTYAKAGVMIRETLAANSVNANVVVSPTNGVAMVIRPTVR